MPRHRFTPPPLSAVIAAGLALAGLAAVWLVPTDLLIGSAQADLGQQFLAWRAFAAAQLRAGHLPLWNPYAYGGEPFLGGFQSAVFYPPNLMFLALPLCRAVNLSLLLHAFILGGGIYAWVRARGRSEVAAWVAAIMLLGSGAVLPHVYAGHLPNLCSLAWAPWIFWALEGPKPDRRKLAIAAAAVAMQILAGQLQYVFYTAVAVALAHARHGLRPLLAYVVGCLLAAAQIIPGYSAASEGLRQGALERSFAAQFSLPPESVLTAVAPGFFGDPTRHPYWGRGYPWEMSLFLGAGALILIACALAAPLHRRRAAAPIILAAILLVFALGAHTPLFRLLYAVPGFDRFRGWSKFDFPAFLFLALAAAEGVDAVRAKPLLGFIRVGTGAMLLGAPCALAGAWLIDAPSLLGRAIHRLYASGESYFPAALVNDPTAIHAAGLHAGHSLLAASLALVLGGGFLLLRQRWSGLGYGLLALVPIEAGFFARSQLATFRLREAVPPELRSFVAAHPGDYRVQNLLEPNNGYLLGAPDIWGNDPALLRRWAALVSWTQGIDPAHATQNVNFHTPSPLFSLLRLRFFFTRTDSGIHEYEMPDPMPRVQIVSDYQVAATDAEVFGRLGRPGFDPRSSVILEAAPTPRPAAGPAIGSARVVSDSPDGLVVSAQVDRPALLLVTDAYSKDWMAESAAAPEAAPQARYEVMPADYAVRATPLAAGSHLIRFDYRPPGIWAGLVVSILAWIGWLGLVLGGGRRTA